MKKNLVFDLDGTLLDSRLRHAIVLSDSINKINDTHYKYTDFADFVPYKSSGKAGLEYLQSKKIPNAAVIMNHWVKVIEYKRYLRYDSLYADALPSLMSLKEDYSLSLVTARANKNNALWQLLKLDIMKFFSKIIVVSNRGNVGVNKHMSLDNTSIFAVVGDTEGDMFLSDLSACAFYPVNYGFRSNEFWEKKGVKPYGSLQEIVNKLIYRI